VDVKIRFDPWKVADWKAAMGTRGAQALGLLGILGLGTVVEVSRQDDAGAGPGLAEVVVGGLPSAPPGLERLVLPSAAGAAASAGAPLVVASFAPVDPVQAGLDHGRLSGVERAVAAEVRRGAFPGAALAVGRGESPVLLRGVGHTAWGGEAVDPAGTVYDLASLTKVVATTTAAMLLVEDGRLDLDAPARRYLPAFSGGAKDRVTVRHLLAHTSGLPAWAELRAGTPGAALARAVATPLKSAPGERAEYSDVGFVVLWAVAEGAAGEPLEDLLQRRVFEPLGMSSTRFRPEADCASCAPTARRKDGTPVRGLVHDPIARHFAGLTGNAGLFGTAEDMGRFAAMLASGGELHGVRVLREATIRDFAKRQPGAATRALGWDTPDRRGQGAAGLRISPLAFGHTGYTGTSLWIDPDRGTWVVLLTNRTYAPKAPNRIQALRRSVNDQVAQATLAAPRGAEAMLGE
jgi:serine-type D-Ala-D-Ala carboxypeptidase